MQMATRILIWASLAASVAWVSGSAWGAGGGGGGATRADGSPTEVARAVELIKAERFVDAVALLQPYVQQARKDADGHNWLAYAYRRSGRLALAFDHYRRALALEPTHRGAHEYIGEAYLQAGQPEKAEFHLQELARLCSAACEEYDDLKAAVARHRAAAAPRAP